MFVACNIGVKVSLSKGNEAVMALVYPGSLVAYWCFRRSCVSNGLAMTEGLYGSLITIATVAIALLVFHEVLSPRQMLGAALVALGLLLLL